MVKTLSIVFTAVGFGLTSISYLKGGYIWQAIVLILIPVLLVVATIRRMDFVQTPGLFIALGSIAAGIAFDLTIGLLFVATIFSLAGWDLADFSIRIRMAGPDDQLDSLIKSHLLRLGMTLAAGGLLIFITFRLSFALPFGWSAILAILATLGLAVMIHAFLKSSQGSLDR